MNPEAVYEEAVAGRTLPDPFGEERTGLAAIPEANRTDQEARRLANLTAFEAQRKQLQPAFHAAMARADYTTIEGLATRLLKLGQGLMILLLLAGAARAQTIPLNVTDPAMSEDLSYLDQQNRDLKNFISSVAAQIPAPSVPGAVTGSIINYSSTTPTTTVFSNTTFGTWGISGSTLTVTLTGGKVKVWYSGTGSASGTTSLALLILVDDAIPAGYSSTVGMTQDETDYTRNLSFSHTFAGLAAGVHTFKLTGAMQSATGTVPGIAQGGLSSKPEFGLYEVKP